MDPKEKLKKEEELKDRLHKAGSAPGAEEKLKKSFFKKSNLIIDGQSYL